MVLKWYENACVCVRACVRACVCVCVRNELEVCTTLAYSHNYEFIPYYASAIHTHTHARILKPFEDREPTGLQVDIAGHESGSANSRKARFLGVTDICSGHLLEC